MAEKTIDTTERATVFPAYGEQNNVVAIDFSESHLIVTTRDGRAVHVPLSWFPWLESASPEQRANADLMYTSIYWPDLDEGISMNTILLGRHQR